MSATGLSWRWRLRLALGDLAQALLPHADSEWAVRQCKRLRRSDFAVTLGHFPANDSPREAIVAANMAICAAMAEQDFDAFLAVKAPPLGFDAASLDAIVKAAWQAGLPMVFDAHAIDHAEATIVLVESLLDKCPGTGIALPARWQRSQTDALRLRDSSARIRLVKGEWGDPAGDPADVRESFMGLVRALAGREAPVGIATHDPVLADAALRLLLAAGTPCKLELLRGLPRKRCVAVARKLGVRVRFYLPFGDGWWPYAMAKALDRPYLPQWWLRDLIG